LRLHETLIVIGSTIAVGIAALAAKPLFGAPDSDDHVGAPFDSHVLSLSPLDVARGDPERVEGSKGELAQGATDYVGAQACATCHRQVHDAWTAGRHSKMIQPATTATIKGDFSQRGATLQGRRYGFRLQNGEYFITESELTGKPQEHRVEYTLGSRRIQHYLTTIDKGRIVVLAPSWDVQRQQWFHNVEIIRPDEDDRQIVQQWNKNCVGCHVSRQDNGYNPATRAYETRWMDFGTSCERCHGPGRAHVDRYASRQSEVTSQSRSEDRMIVRPTRLDPTASSAICGQCHSLRTVVNPDYKAGDAFYDFFVPVLEYVPVAAHSSQDPPYWADGRPRRFSNDAIGLWQSACFLRGGATCTTCHVDPHLPDIDRNPRLASGSSNALCSRCHEDVEARLTAHTHHPAASRGSACVECHMPKTVVSIKSTMRDHTISVPAPENTVRFGIPNACTECHTDKPAAWAADVLKTWWPDGRRRQLIAQAEAFSAARAGRRDAIELLIAIAEDHRFAPLTRANAIGYLRSFTDPPAVAARTRAATADHPAIRATAMVGLGELGHENQAARAAIVGGLGDRARAVRIGALLALLSQGGEDLSAGDFQRFQRVGAELVAWARTNQHNGELQRAEGIVHLLTGDFTAASAALEISVDLDPGSGSARFFLALARIGQRRVDDARALLLAIPRSDPYYQKAQAQLQKLP
jgi:predicted CXXCH cytochrome family protein